MRQWWTNLGTNVTPALTRDVKAAIAAHLNVSTLSAADSFLRKQSPSFIMSALNFTVWNPAFARPASLLLNLRAGSSGLVQRRPGAAATSVLWVESGGGGGGGGRVRREISDAEDPRPVRLNGALYVVFVRYLARRHKRVVLARLEEPYREVQLRYANSTGSEGNWLPFEHAGRLYVSYTLCPHRVLAVDVATGVCTTAYETHRPGCLNEYGKRERGSASGFELGKGTALGLGHFKSSYGLYTHFFFLRSTRPPFPILRASREFRLATTPIDDNVIGPAKQEARASCVRAAGENRSLASRCKLPTACAGAACFALRGLPRTDRQVQYILSLRRGPPRPPPHPSRHALAARGEAGTADSSDGGLHPRQETGGSGFDGGGCRTDHLLLDFGAADTAALTLQMGRAEFCRFVGGNFTQWCECERRGGGGGEGGRDARDMRAAPDQASSSQGPVLTSIDAKAGSGRGFAAAIVIKGPLLPFTEDVIAYYATTLPTDVAVVFSHTNGPCFTAARLQTLRHLARVHPNFEWTIHAAPPSDGANHRNVQRESTYYGVRFAAEALGARDVLMQRADSVFQNASRLFSDLRRVRDALPPPTVPMPGGRVGLCPTQMQLTDTYGRFHLDDHCMFGSAEALLYFWAVDNVFYDRRAEAWSSAAMGNARRGCKLPAVESDNGFIWVRDGLARRGMPPPQSTLDLIAQRAFILNAAAWGHVCRRKRTNQRLHLPVDPDKFNVLSPEVVGRAAPLGVYAQCTAREFTYDCAGVGDDVQARTDTPRWACSASNTHC